MFRQAVALLAGLTTVFLFVAVPLRADAAPEEKVQVRQYQSRHFVVRTDATPEEAKELLKQLETMLGLISGYWGRPCNGMLECYVVKDIKNWPANAFPADAYGMVANGGGLTKSLSFGAGTPRVKAKAVAYAVLERGVPLHEAVHAYCGQTFGTTGPTWYAEGMAEMGNYWREGKKDVNTEPVVMQYLQQSAPRSLREIVAPNQTAGTWKEYAWRWALCHLLANNPNYADRFRPLGMGFLTKQPVSFEQTYGAMANEISFEYLFFLEHLDQGLRADLIAWDWKKKFLPLKNDRKTVLCRVLAKRGWQPTGLTVAKGDQYRLETSGDWKLEEDGPKLSADGGSKNQGRLVGALMKDWTLSEPFFLGAEGTFIAPGDGDLYLRANDAWNKLADNSGRVTAKIEFVTESPEPTDAVFVSTRDPADELRTWTDSSGQFQIKARLLGAKDGSVRLRREDGQTLTVALEKLSEEDREFVREVR